MKVYKAVFTKEFSKDLKKLDKYKQGIILDWIDRNIKETTQPRALGKPLQGDMTGKWGYRIGDYRIIAKIQDEQLIVLALTVGHRKEIYQKK